RSPRFRPASTAIPSPTPRQSHSEPRTPHSNSIRASKRHGSGCSTTGRTTCSPNSSKYSASADVAVTYPVVEPHASGLLDVGDGHRVYWEVRGNQDGKSAVVLHGGPGSGANASWTDVFDPTKYRVVLLDQRGCGRSTPNAADT